MQAEAGRRRVACLTLSTFTSLPCDRVSHWVEIAFSAGQAGQELQDLSPARAGVTGIHTTGLCFWWGFLFGIWVPGIQSQVLMLTERAFFSAESSPDL